MYIYIYIYTFIRLSPLNPTLRHREDRSVPQLPSERGTNKTIKARLWLRPEPFSAPASFNVFQLFSVQHEFFQNIQLGQGGRGGVSHRPHRTECVHWLVLESQTPPQNRQFIVLINKSEHRVDDFVGGLTF